MDPQRLDGAVVTAQQYLTVYGLRLAAALAIFIVGKFAAKILSRVLDQSMTRTNVEPTLATFVKNLVYCALLVFITVAALAQLGLQTASFVALVGAAGLAIGLALQGSLSNFASGVLIVVFHPFRIGDQIEAAGTKGIVTEIQIFHTVLKLADTRKQVVPNSVVMAGPITVGVPKPPAEERSGT